MANPVSISLIINLLLFIIGFKVASSYNALNEYTPKALFPAASLMHTSWDTVFTFTLNSNCLSSGPCPPGFCVISNEPSELSISSACKNTLRFNVNVSLITPSWSCTSKVIASVNGSKLATSNLKSFLRVGIVWIVVHATPSKETWNK